MAVHGSLEVIGVIPLGRAPVEKDPDSDDGTQNRIEEHEQNPRTQGPSLYDAPGAGRDFHEQLKC